MIDFGPGDGEFGSIPEESHTPKNARARRGVRLLIMRYICHMTHQIRGRCHGCD